MHKKLSIGNQVLEYELYRGGVKNLNLRIRPDGSVRVSAPQLVPQADIDRFVSVNFDRICAARNRYALRHKQEAEEAAACPQSAVLFGVAYPMQISQGKKNCVLRNGTVFLTLPNPAVIAEIRQLLKLWQKKELTAALESLQPRLQSLFAGTRVPPVVSFTVRDMKTRWGSCNPKKAHISVNSRLSALAPELLEYVLIHEYCHFLQPDHSPQFYAYMDFYLPGWQARKKQLNQKQQPD